MLDGLYLQEEIVVKPLSSMLRKAGLFSGATVLGNGHLALILDAAMIAARAGLKPHSASQDVAPAPVAEQATQRFVTYDDGHRREHQDERRAVPIELIERIETVPLAGIFYAEGAPRIAYQGETLELEDACGLIERIQALKPCRGSSVTTLICNDPASPDPRFAIAVKRVFDVAYGSLQPPNAGEHGRFAIVDSQRMLIPQRFAGSLGHASLAVAG